MAIPTAGPPSSACEAVPRLDALYTGNVDELQAAFVELIRDTRIGGRYVVDRLIGVGGMGLVVAARYPELEQDVAIKFMLPQYAANTVLSARFLREARLAARVKSPHFVRVFDMGRIDAGVPYIVMELLSGRNLGDELEARGALPPTEVVDWVLQAAAGIAELHALGIVHRDLKPSNLFLAEAAGSHVLKVLDFGVSKDRAEGAAALTSTGHMIGTPHYMSPEQVKESKTTDTRTDVWALGVILHELLTATLPFGARGDAPGEVFGLVLHTEPRKVRSVRPEIPEELEQIVLTCLRRDASERYADVGELAEALRPFAPPAAVPRIAAIKKTLATPRATADTAAAAPSDDVETSRAPKLASPLAAQEPRARKPVAETLRVDQLAPPRDESLAGQSTSARSPEPGTPAPAPEQRKTGRGAWIALAAAAGLAVVALVAAATIHGSTQAKAAAAERGSNAAVADTATSLATSTPPPATAPPIVTATASPTPPATATATPPATSTSTSTATSTPIATSTHAAPHPHASSTPHATGKPAPSASPASVLEGLDRK